MVSNNKLTKLANNNQDYEKALALVSEAFFNRYPKFELPAWFNNCVTVGGSKNQQQQWVISYSVVPFLPLKENQHWEEIRGGKVVVEVDPSTGKRAILISRDGPAPIVLFEAAVDPIISTITVFVDIDPFKLDGSAFENYN